VDPLTDLISRQSGMVARRQLLTLGLDADRVRNQVASGRWVPRSPRVLSTTTGELTWQQRCWLGVLHAGPHSLIGSLTAAGIWGLERWTRSHVTVLVDDQLSFEPVPGISCFRSRRPLELLAASRNGLPLVRLEPAFLLFAAYEAHPRAAHGVLAASVQQRLTTAARLEEWIHLLGPLRRARAFRRSLVDIGSGAHSAAELAGAAHVPTTPVGSSRPPDAADGSVRQASLDRLRVGSSGRRRPDSRGRWELPLRGRSVVCGHPTGQTSDKS
jgi:hypothetical protein